MEVDHPLLVLAFAICCVYDGRLLTLQQSAHFTMTRITSELSDAVAAQQDADGSKNQDDVKSAYAALSATAYMLARIVRKSAIWFLSLSCVPLIVAAIGVDSYFDTSPTLAATFFAATPVLVSVLADLYVVSKGENLRQRVARLHPTPKTLRDRFRESLNDDSQ